MPMLRRDAMRRVGLRPPRMRVKRVTSFSINRMIPNVLTLLALCAGMSAIRYAMIGKFEEAVIAIIVAGILDGLDGRMARLLKANSSFGAQLDSLSDFLSFGAAPAIVLYFWTLAQLGSLGWVTALFFAACCALRLARFNTQLDVELPPYAYNFFTGVAGAGRGRARHHHDVRLVRVGRRADPLALAQRGDRRRDRGADGEPGPDRVAEAGAHPPRLRGPGAARGRRPRRLPHHRALAGDDGARPPLPRLDPVQRRPVLQPEAHLRGAGRGARGAASAGRARHRAPARRRARGNARLRHEALERGRERLASGGSGTVSENNSH
jgi:CDP-diacylglycerol--serine O-phosphatidyltransferase